MLMLKVNRSQVTFAGNGILADASTLGLAPGLWPAIIAVVDERDEGFMFAHPVSHRGDNGDYYVTYTDPTGVCPELIVFND